MEVKEGSVLCFGWNDNALVTGLSTIHGPPFSEADYVIKKRRRRANPRPAFAEVFGEYSIRWLPIPKAIDDYNNYMNGVDLADQSRRYLTTHKKGW